MQNKGLNHRLKGMVVFRSRITTLMLSMFATLAAFYVAGRLWQDAENRVYLIKELDRITGQGRSAISVDDSLKITSCREQLGKLSALEMELAAARQEGFISKHSSRIDGTHSNKKPLVVIGILTGFGRKNKRDAVRKAWMGTGAALKKMESAKGIVVRFVIGRSANRGDEFDLEVDIENKQTNDFIILNNYDECMASLLGAWLGSVAMYHGPNCKVWDLDLTLDVWDSDGLQCPYPDVELLGHGCTKDDHVEAPETLPKKTMFFFAHVAERWDAQFYAKANDNVYVNIDALGSTLAAHEDEPRVYMGCMKSGEVFSEPTKKWYEPDWWKFGDGKTYFRHASGEIFVISQALAKFVSINRSNLRSYAHDDVSVGSWFIGLDVKHIDERKFCCSSWSSGAICSGV